MEVIPKNRLFEFNTDQLNSVRKKYNLDKPGDMSRAIDVLETWVKMQKHFTKKELPRNCLEKAILTSKGSLERAKQRLDKICTFRNMMPDFFRGNLTTNKFEELEIFHNSLLPQPTHENYRIYFFKAIGTKFSPENIVNYYKYVVLLTEYILAYDYNDGVIIVIDYTEANLFEIIKALNLTELRKIVAIITEGYGMRLIGIHMVTPSKAIETFVSIIKQFLSPKLGKRIHVHSDMNSVCQYIPKDILPMEYGGKAKSLLKLRDELHDEVTKEDFVSYMEEMSNAKTDETYRDTDITEKYIDMAGSFRTLNVD